MKDTEEGCRALILLFLFPVFLSAPEYKYMCKCVFVYVSCQTPGVGPLVSDCQARIERSRLSACHTQAGHHHGAIRQSVDHSERCQSSSEESRRSYVSP